MQIISIIKSALPCMYVVFYYDGEQLKTKYVTRAELVRLKTDKI